MFGEPKSIQGEKVAGYVVAPGSPPRRFAAVVDGEAEETGETVVHPYGRLARLMRLPPCFVVPEDGWIAGRPRSFLYVAGSTRTVRIGSSGEEIRGAGAAQSLPRAPQPDEEESEAIADAQVMALAYHHRLTEQIHGAASMGAADPMAGAKMWVMAAAVGLLLSIAIAGYAAFTLAEVHEMAAWLIQQQAAQAAAGGGGAAPPPSAVPPGFPPSGGS